MTDAAQVPLVDDNFAEDYRHYLTDEFFDDLAIVKAELATGTIPEVFQVRGKSHRSISGIRASILHELHRLLCTDDDYYESVRLSAKQVSQDGAKMIAGYVVASSGIAPTIVTGMIAFLTLAVLAITTQVFCERYSHAKQKMAGRSPIP